MTFPLQYWGYFIAVIAVVTALYFMQPERRQRLGQILIALLTAFILTFVVTAIAGNKLVRTNTSVGIDNAEMQLRLITAISATKDMLRKQAVKMPWIGTFGSEVQQSDRVDAVVGTIPRQQAFDAAATALRAAIAQAPESGVLKGKLIVLLGTADRSAHRSELKNLVEQLRSPRAIAAGTSQADGTSQSTSSAALWPVLQAIYINAQVSKADVEAYKAIVVQHMPRGWFRDNALLQIYQLADQKALYDQLKEQVDQSYTRTFLKLSLMTLIMLGAGLIGVINILIQLGTVAARPMQPPDAVGLDIAPKTVFVVFVVWFSIMLITSICSRFIISKIPGYSTDTVLMASGTAITYLISNLPGPFLIYWLALKPKGLNFWSALQLRSRTATAGPAKLVAAGYLAWCSAIPLIFVSAFIAQRFLHTQGSDNPVIGQIVLAAGSSSAVSTLIFYLTLGVMAPIFEEILFRGFFYSAIKPRIGAFPGMLASAALFALLHFDKGGVLMLLAIGFVLAYTFEKTRSLLPSIVAHGLWNSGSFTMALVLFGA